MESPKEANRYDKVIKENLEALFIPFLEQLLNIRILASERLPGKMQSTLEREADFLCKILAKDGQTEILHLEFESGARKSLVYRQSEYHGVLLKKYRLPVRHVVVYLGERRPNIVTQLPPEMVFTGFELIDLGRLDYRQMLSSQVPEAVVLAILGNFNEEPPEQVLRSILERLQQVAKGELSLEKYLRQLNVLSGLRKLHEITVKTIEDMPITYDIRTDFLYKKGKEEGLEEGIEKGRQEGRQEGREEGREEGIENKERIIVTRAWKKGLPAEEIAELADMPLERVQEIIAELEAEAAEGNA